jgi:hypothetical protein
LQKAQFTAAHLPEPVMPPHDAARQLVRNNVDYLPIDEIEGRVAATLFVVYPPGIATIVPGERLSERARPMIDYLKVFDSRRQRRDGQAEAKSGTVRKRWHLDFDQPATPATPGRPPYKNEIVQRWTAAIAQSDGFVFVTPEYNYGLSLSRLAAARSLPGDA